MRCVLVVLIVAAVAATLAHGFSIIPLSYSRSHGKSAAAPMGGAPLLSGFTARGASVPGVIGAADRAGVLWGGRTVAREGAVCDGPGSLSPGCTSVFFLEYPSDLAIFSNSRHATIYAQSDAPDAVAITMRCASRASHASIQPYGCVHLNIVGRPDLCFVSIWAPSKVYLYACYDEA